MPIFSLRDKAPQIDDSTFVSEQASIVGDVKIGPRCSIGPGTILRGGYAKITLNENVHVQDAVLIHAHQKNAPVEILSHTVIEHASVLYGCSIGEACKVGAGSLILDGAKLGEGVLLSQNSFVPSGMVLPPRMIMTSEQPGIPVAGREKLSIEQINQFKKEAEASRTNKRSKAIYSLRDKTPQIDDTAFISEQASIIGDVEIGPHCSIWPGTIIRGEFAKITLKESVHVQDAVIIHTHQKNAPAEISSYSTIETADALYGCFIGEACVVGTGSLIFDGVTLGEGVLLAPNSFVPSGMVIPPRVIMRSEQLGVPVASVRKLSMEEINVQRDRAERYAETFQKLGRWYSKIR